MKRLASILLLSLTLIPVIWNGINMIHYVVEHTHVFCTNYDDHTHQTVEECSSFCVFEDYQHQYHFSIQNDYQELKIYLTLHHLSFNFKTPLSLYQSIFLESPAWEHSFIRDIFRPPLS